MTADVNQNPVLDPGASVGSIAAALPSSTRVFEKWKIDYCCGGKRSLADACDRAGVDVATMVAEIDEVTRGYQGGDRNWSTTSLQELSGYIVATHHRYTREETEALVALAAKVDGVHGANHSELHEVFRIVSQLHPELFQHMMKEEQILFPFVSQLEAAIGQGTSAPTPFFGTVENPIQMMISEHDQAGEMLEELRRITSNYALPEDACMSYRTLYERLQALEADLHTHIHLENNIYFPRAIELEQSARS